jgi:hypothetical protein
MEAEKTYQNKVPRTIQQKRGGEGALEFVDNRQGGILQAVAEPMQRLEDEDETLQGKFEQPVQRLGDEEDETLQGKFAQTVQREEDDDEALQGKFEQPVQKKNETGMPDNLKAGIEDLSGFSMCVCITTPTSRQPYRLWPTRRVRTSMSLPDRNSTCPTRHGMWPSRWQAV